MSEILTGQPDSPGPAADTGPARDPGRHEVLPPADWEPGWEPLQDTDPAEDFALAAAVADWDPGDSPAGPLPPGWTGAGEAFPAGFLHRVLYDDVPRGAGFASGGVLDEMEAGPVLALLPDSAAGPGAGGHAGLGESELIGVLCAWRRIASWAAAGQATAVLALSRRRHVQAREQQNRHLSEHVGDEIAAALTLTGRAAAGLHEEVLALARLPEVHQCLAAGRIDWPRAAVFPPGREKAATDISSSRSAPSKVLRACSTGACSTSPSGS